MQRKILTYLPISIAIRNSHSFILTSSISNLSLSVQILLPTGHIAKVLKATCTSFFSVALGKVVYHHLAPTIPEIPVTKSVFA